MTFAAIRLELHHPEVRGCQTARESWDHLCSVLYDVRSGTQQALGDFLVVVRDLRSEGQRRWPTRQERSRAKDGIPPPSECWDLGRLGVGRELLTRALRATGLSEYVYASVAERVSSSELAGTKLASLLTCRSAYPVATSVPIVVRSRNCRVSVADGVPVVRLTSLRPGQGPVRLVCKRLHGRAAPRLVGALERIQAGDWSIGAVSIHRRERDGKWYLLVPYDSGKVPEAVGQVAAVHRGVAHWLTLVTERGQVCHLPGFFVASHKVEYGRRRRMLQQDLAARGGRGRGRRDAFRALKKLQDAEARWVETAAQQAARWVERQCVRLGVGTVVLDDFAQPFSRACGDDHDQRKGPEYHDDKVYLPWWVRRFPMGLVRQKVEDALTRRAGVGVEVVSGAYASQQCCRCGHVSAANVVRLPKVGDFTTGELVVAGLQRCESCGQETELDEAAARNLLRRREGKEDAA